MIKRQFAELFGNDRWDVLIEEDVGDHYCPS